MAFNSYSYLLLLIPAIALFWALPVAARRWYVLALSVSYYATWNAFFVAVPAVLCMGVYSACRLIIARPQGQGRMAFWSGITLILAIFGAFRYRDFGLQNLNALLSLFHAAPVPTTLHLAVPLGISFYSFEAISYLIDARQGRIKDARFSDLFLFVMFWPHLMAGPIVRYRELVPQFTFAKPFEISMLTKGLDRLLLGLVQKNVISNSLGIWVDQGFAPQASLNNSTLDNWVLAVSFGLQIYFDFAAYSNMAIGVSQLIGVNLPENFRFPYHASNPADFWNRWHMTLSRWIRDYLFFPINVRFKGAAVPLYGSLIGVMALVGLWHGPGWGFILWGLIHGACLVGYRIWEQSWAGRVTGVSAVLSRGCWRIFTLIAVTVAWVPFRATTAVQVSAMLKSMFVVLHFGTSYSVNLYLNALIFAVLAVVEPYVPPMLEAFQRRFSDLSWPSSPVVQFGLVRPLFYSFAIALFLIADDRNRQFIYFQF